MKIFTIIPFLLFAWASIQAQEPGPKLIRAASKAIGFNMGYQSRQLLDEQKSALTYASEEYLAGLFFTREGHQSLFKVSLKVGTGDYYAKHFRNRWLYSANYELEENATIDSLPVNSVLTGGNFDISYLLKLNPGRRTTWLTGASVREMMVYTENKIGLLNSVGLHANLGFIRELGSKSKMRVNFAVPLLAWNTRLPWHNTASDPMDSEIKTFFKKGSRLVGPEDFRMAELAVEYQIRVLHGWSIGAGYSFTGLNIPTHQPLKSVLHSFQIQTSFNL